MHHAGTQNYRTVSSSESAWPLKSVEDMLYFSPLNSTYLRLLVLRLCHYASLALSRTHAAMPSCGRVYNKECAFSIHAPLVSRVWGGVDLYSAIYHTSITPGNLKFSNAPVIETSFSHVMKDSEMCQLSLKMQFATCSSVHFMFLNKSFSTLLHPMDCLHLQ